jgi:hypothetical protein
MNISRIGLSWITPTTKRQSRQGDDHVEQHVAEFGDALGQRGLQLDHLGNQVRDAARLGFVARGDDDSLPPARR